MLGIMAGMTRRTRTPLVSGSHLFAVLLGSTVDTCYVSLQWLLWVELFVLSAMLGSTVALGDDFVEMVVFSAMLGSTVALGDDFVAMVVFSAMLGSTLRNAWFNSGYRFMRQTTEAGFAGAVLFFSLVRPMMRCIMAGMDQEYSYVGVAWWKLWRFRSCSSSQVVDYSFVLRRQLSMVPPCRKTIEISQLQYTVIDVVQVHFTVVAQRQSPWSKLFV